MFVHEAVHDEVVERVAAYAGMLPVSCPRVPVMVIGPLISARHQELVEGHTRAAQDEGARWCAVASRSTGRATSCGRCGSPTRVTRSRRTSRPALLARASTVRSNAFLHYRTGALLDGAHDFSDGAPDAGAGREQPHRNLHIHRADLHDALARELEQRSPGAVRLGRRLVDVAQSNDSVTAAFAGDGSATGDLLVGADGLRSRVRELLWGQEIPRFTGQVAFRFLVPAAAAAPFVDHVGRAAVYFGPDRVFNRYGLRRGAIVNGVAIARTDSWHGEAWTTPATTAELLDLYEGWHPDVLGLIAAAPAPTKWALYDREPLPCPARPPRHHRALSPADRAAPVDDVSSFTSRLRAGPAADRGVVFT